MKMKMKKHWMKFKGGRKQKKDHHCGMFGKVVLFTANPDETEGHDFHHYGHGFHKRKMMKHHFKHHFEEHGRHFEEHGRHIEEHGRHFKEHGFHGCRGRRGFKNHGHHKHGHCKRGFFFLEFESDSSESSDSHDETTAPDPLPTEKESAPVIDVSEPSAPMEEVGESSASKE